MWAWNDDETLLGAQFFVLPGTISKHWREYNMIMVQKFHCAMVLCDHRMNPTHCVAHLNAVERTQAEV